MFLHFSSFLKGGFCPSGTWVRGQTAPKAAVAGAELPGGSGLFCTHGAFLGTAEHAVPSFLQAHPPSSQTGFSQVKVSLVTFLMGCRVSWTVLDFPRLVRIAYLGVKKLYLDYSYLKNLKSKKKKAQNLATVKWMFMAWHGALPCMDPCISCNLAVWCVIIINTACISGFNARSSVVWRWLEMMVYNDLEGRMELWCGADLCPFLTLLLMHARTAPNQFGAHWKAMVSDPGPILPTNKSPDLKTGGVWCHCLS